MAKKSNWTEAEDALLRQHVGKKTLSEIAELLGKPENAVYLYCYRHGIPLRERLTNPMMRNLLTIKFGDPDYFTPNRDFFTRVKISQKRWASLQWGYTQPTQDELRRVAIELNFSVEETFRLMDSRQLNLFD